jgi:hypothetical protein
MDRIDNDKMLDSKRREKEVHQYVFTSIAGFILSAALVIFIYSRISARKIKVPLQQITEGIETMIQGNYKVRLREFGYLRERPLSNHSKSGGCCWGGEHDPH